MMYFFLNSLFFSVLQPPLIRIIELCHESPVIVYFPFVTEFYAIFYYKWIFLPSKYNFFINRFSTGVPMNGTRVLMNFRFIMIDLNFKIFL